jgi:hypothetical protein
MLAFDKIKIYILVIMEKNVGQNGPEFVGDTLLFNANAMVQRASDEIRESQEIASEITGLPNPNDNNVETLEPLLVAIQSYIYRDIISGSRSVDVNHYILEIVNNLSDEFFIEMIRHNGLSDTEEVDPQFLRNFLRAQLNSLLGALDIEGSDSGDEEIKSQYELASNFSDSLGVQFTDIFSNEDLYCQFMAYCQTANEFAKARLERAEDVQSKLKDIMVSQLRTTAEAFTQLDEDLFDEDEDIDSALEEVFSDPEIINDFNETVTKYGISLHVLIKRDLGRFYGQKAYEDLPE